MPRAFRSPGSKSFRRENVSVPNADGARCVNAEAALLGRLKTACRPTYIGCLHRVPRQPSFGHARTSDIRTSESRKGGTRFDPGQHHPALTLRAAWPIDGKQGRVGMTIGFRHDASPALGGSATLSVTGRCRNALDPIWALRRWSVLSTFRESRWPTLKTNAGAGPSRSSDAH